MNDSTNAADFFKDMSNSELIWHFSSDGNTAGFAYRTLFRHLCAAKLQSQRIASSLTYINQNMPREENITDVKSSKEYFQKAESLYDLVFIEIHFYFICWVNCHNMMKALCSLPEFIEAKKYLDGKQRHFGEYAEARNTFEHFSDRLPAGKNASRVKEVRETADSGPYRNFGGIKDKSYTFSDKSWDITSSSFDLLESMANEFSNILLDIVMKKRDALAGN